MPDLDRVRIWFQANGQRWITVYNDKHIRIGETEDQFIDRTDQKLAAQGGDLGESVLKKRNDFPDLVFVDKFKKDSSGTISIDHSVKTPYEQSIEDMEAGMNKLKALGLTLTDLKALFG